jgi:hypothetical protein
MLGACSSSSTSKSKSPDTSTPADAAASGASQDGGIGGAKGSGGASGNAGASSDAGAGGSSHEALDATSASTPDATTVSTPDASSGSLLTSQTIDTTGGSLPSSDGKLLIGVPLGALTTTIDLTVEPATDAPSGHLGPAYEIGPTGTTFAHPITLSFDYDPSWGPANLLRVATVSAGGTWVSINTAADQTHIEGSTTHLSTYGIIVQGGAGPTCGSGADCSQGMTCANGRCQP